MPGRSEEPIRVHVNNHDRSQIEFSIDYRPKFVETFHTDVYFFLPRNFGIHSNSYTRDQFYNDLINYLRFHTPVNLELLQDEMQTLAKMVESETTAQERERLTPLAIQQIKLLANRANSVLKKLYEQFEAFEASDHQKLICVLKNTYRSIEVFRNQFVVSAHASSLKIPAEVRQTLLNSDEFMSNRVIASCSDLLHAGRADPDKTELIAALNEILAREKEHRKSLGDLFVSARSHERDREYFYFRHSLLKKEVSQPLYIDKKSAKQDRIYRNWVAGSGAALAGLWAQIAEYQTHRFHGHQDFGLSMIGLGFIAIIAYVFKDRIKDVSKEYISEKMKLFLPDFRSKLNFSEVEKSGNRITHTLGSLSEYMRFTSVKGVPEDIYYLRKLRGRRDIGTEKQESVIQYHKTVTLDAKTKILGCERRLHDIKDIHRFNFSYFLSHLDDAKKQLSVYDDDEGPAKISAPKVYHVNVVSHVRSATVSIYNHFRVVLDKEGIVRIETVLPMLQMNNKEDTP